MYLSYFEIALFSLVAAWVVRLAHTYGGKLSGDTPLCFSTSAWRTFMTEELSSSARPQNRDTREHRRHLDSYIAEAWGYRKRIGSITLVWSRQK